MASSMSTYNETFEEVFTLGNRSKYFYLCYMWQVHAYMYMQGACAHCVKTRNKHRRLPQSLSALLCETGSFIKSRAHYL